jgi:hypothetical protein
MGSCYGTSGQWSCLAGSDCVCCGLGALSLSLSLASAANTLADLAGHMVGTADRRNGNLCGSSSRSPGGAGRCSAVAAAG